MNEMESVGREAVVSPAPTAQTIRKERLWLFTLLIAPSAVLMNGVVQGGVLAYVLSEQGIGSGGRSHIIWLLSLPTSLYFLWSPITDFFVRRRTWLLVGGITAGLMMAVAFAVGRLNSRSAMLMMFLGACFSQLVVSSCGGIMGTLTLERARRVASAFYQSGSLAFGAIAAFVLVLLSQKTGQRTLGLVAGALIALPALVGLAAPGQPVVAERGFGKTMRRVWSEFKATFLHWRAVPYTLCMLFPMASGAAASLISGVARNYGVNGNSVAWMNGVAGALLMAAGSLTAMAIPARTRAAVAYLTVGLVNAATLAVLWLGPLRPATYFLGVTLYLFTYGGCNATFTAVVLEFMGQSGKTGSGRYSIINSLGNVPVIYMIALDGWGGDQWGPRGIAGTEAVVGGVGAIILLSYFLTRRPMKAAPGR